jgi:hypothetical protein
MSRKSGNRFFEKDMRHSTHLERIPIHRSGMGSGTGGYFQNCREASRAPSAIAASFAHTTSGSTAAWPTQVP